MVERASKAKGRPHHLGHAVRAGNLLEGCEAVAACGAENNSLECGGGFDAHTSANVAHDAGGGLFLVGEKRVLIAVRVDLRWHAISLLHHLCARLHHHPLLLALVV